jgi:hypothetical protein
MATSASQPYIAKLGFQDRDRSNERHGLACEYLFERMLELEVAPWLLEIDRDRLLSPISCCKENLAHFESSAFYKNSSQPQQERIKLEELERQLANFDATSNLADYVLKAHDRNKAGNCVNVPITSRSYVNGFADVLIRNGPRLLGEVKITKEPAENVLQQINFYLNYLETDSWGRMNAVYVVTDYDPGDLKRLCAGTKIKVYRLGKVFDQWLASRTTPSTEEL